SLHKGATEGRIVLSKQQLQAKPIEPYIGFQRAAGVDNVRSVNLVEDADGVVRKVQLFFAVGAVGGPVTQDPGFALDLAARALHATPAREPDGAVRLGEAKVRTAAKNELGVNFDTRPGAIPTYSFADMVACVEAGKADYF